MKIRRCTLFFALALPLTATAQETVYVQSLKAKLLSAPAFNATVVAEADRGDAAAVLETQARWYKVQLGNHSGWLSRLVVSDHAPLNKTTALDAAHTGDISARRRASVATTAGAARGLAADDRLRASQSGLTNYVALEKVEQLTVSEQEALDFLAEGLKQ